MNKKDKTVEEAVKLPAIPKDLLDTLDKLFPEKTPDINQEYREICFRSGQRSVVKFLHEKFKQQSETILEDK